MAEPHALILDHRTVYQGRVLSLDTDRVRLPNGHETTLEVVRHAGAVVLIPMPDTAHVVLVRQYRYAIDRWIWEAPAGCIDPGETPEAAAIRECQEETGLIPGRLEPLGRFYPTPGYCDELMHFFRLTDLTEPRAGSPVLQPDVDEDLRIRTFAVGAIREMVRTGEIVDLKTVVALEFAAAASAVRTV